MKNSINCDNCVIWNNPLYIPIPDPIDWIYRVFKDNTPEYMNIIADILLKYIEDILLLSEGRALATIKINMDKNIISLLRELFFINFIL